jgi:RHS repeat-associated protein
MDAFTQPALRNFGLVGRYYDPVTGEFLSVDPNVATTGQPNEFAEGDPVNEKDTLVT